MKLSDIEFEDINFKTCVLEGGFEDTNDVVELICRKNKIKSIKGVEHLTELTLLDLTRNQLSDIDLSKNTKLEELFLGNNAIESLNISGCTALTHLEVFMNELEEIDISKNIFIEDLWADLNNLKAIDLSSSSELVDLRVNSNDITDLDLTRNTKLEKLLIQENPLSDDVKAKLSKLTPVLVKT